MSLTYLDIGLIAICLLSGIFALVRGFVREVLSLASWGLAAFAALVLHPRFLPLVADKITNELVAKIVVIAVIFIVVLLIVGFITGRISDMVLDSSVGFIDRALGFFFGLARGFLIVTIAFMFFAWLVPADKGGRPDFVTNAKFLTTLENASAKVWSYMPENPGDVVKDKLNKTLENKPNEPKK